MLKKKKGGFLNVIETVGNKLPHPGTLFLIMAIIVSGISVIGALLGWTVTYEGLVKIDGVYVVQEVTTSARSLLSVEGIQYIFENLVSNFTGFAPLGTVLVALVGIGVAERSGFISTALRIVANKTPKHLVTMMVVLLGVLSNAASDAGYVVLPPLAALIFVSFGRNPIAGLAAAFAGVSGGFSANLIPSSLDPLLAGLTQEAAGILDPTYEVATLGNYWFMVASTFLITIVGTIVTEKIVEPRLGAYTGDFKGSFEEVLPLEKKGLKRALVSIVVLIPVIVALYFVLGSTLFLGSGIVPIIVLAFIVPGYVYGKTTGSIKSDADVMEMISASFGAMSGYLVLVFFAAQFINFFSYSNLGTILAVKGADFLKVLNAPDLVLIAVFIVIVAFINLFMGSSSAKWAILAPVFVPMLMQLGISPEFTQLAYRIGDSSTNIVSPLMSYFAMIIVYLQRYDKKASFGTLISTMLPYSIAFLISWIVLLGVWMLLGWDIGIGTAMNYIPM
ncbi:MAG: AbgT family transporter [Eubacteriales bacterium]